MIRTIVGIIGLFTSIMADLGAKPAFALSHYQFRYNNGCIVEPLKKCNCNVTKINSIFEENKSAANVRKVNIENGTVSLDDGSVSNNINSSNNGRDSSICKTRLWNKF